MTLFLVTLIFIGLSAGLAWYLLAHDKGEKEPVMALWMAVGMGAAGALAAVFLEKMFISGSNLMAGTPKDILLASALGVAFVEEICKFLPLAVVLSRRRYFNEHTDGVIYFALAGLGFGLPENIIYTVQFGTHTGMTRLFLTPLFHAATTGTVGYFLARRKLAHKPLAGIAWPLAAVVVLHGLYDFGLASGSVFYAGTALLITLTLSAGLFLLFIKAGQQDRKLGLSVAGHNNFCRSCGFANPQRHLYCTRCGKNA